MTTVRQLLVEKGDDIYYVKPETSILEALALMSEKDVGAVLVLANGRLVGIFSERDYVRKVAELGRPATELTVSDLMSSPVFFVRPNNTAEDCMALMTEKRIRHLPVLENNALMGVISIGDVVRSLIQDRESIIRGLENYITGREHAY